METRLWFAYKAIDTVDDSGKEFSTIHIRGPWFHIDHSPLKGEGYTYFSWIFSSDNSVRKAYLVGDCDGSV